MTVTMRGVAVALVAATAALSMAGCKSNPNSGPTNIPAGLGCLVLDIRRDGGKYSFNYGYVVYRVDVPSSDPEYVVMTEPNIGSPILNPVTKRYDPPEKWPPTMFLKPGRYAVETFGIGACSHSKDVEVKEGETINFRTDMEPGGSVKGMVLGASSGNPLPGVLVWRPLDRGYGTDSKNWEPQTSYTGVASRVVKTDDHGRFYIPNLPPGKNLLVMYFPEFGWTERTVEIVDGKCLELNPMRFEPKQ